MWYLVAWYGKDVTKNWQATAKDVPAPNTVVNDMEQANPQSTAHGSNQGHNLNSHLLWGFVVSVECHSGHCIHCGSHATHCLLLISQEALSTIMKFSSVSSRWESAPLKYPRRLMRELTWDGQCSCRSLSLRNVNQHTHTCTVHTLHDDSSIFAQDRLINSLTKDLCIRYSSSCSSSRTIQSSYGVTFSPCLPHDQNIIMMSIRNAS